MPGLWSRLLAPEPRAAANGLVLDYAATQQNGHDCWFVATLCMLRKKGYRLPKGFNVRGLRAKSRDEGGCKQVCLGALLSICHTQAWPRYRNACVSQAWPRYACV